MEIIHSPAFAYTGSPKVDVMPDLTLTPYVVYVVYPVPPEWLARLTMTGSECRF